MTIQMRIISFLFFFSSLFTTYTIAQSYDSTTSQNSTVKKRLFQRNLDKAFVSAGIGFHGPAYHSGSKAALNLSADFNVYKGLFVGVASNFFSTKLTEDHTWTSGTIGIRFLYHIEIVDIERNILYAGFGSSLFLFHYSDVSEEIHNKYFVPIFLGFRTMIYRDFGLYSEFAFNDMGFIKLGVTIKFDTNTK
ncbi:MAG: hypothetical protein F6K19_13055 [Cyanothece sp. SIO1E1]|nr:hypothetical protein [Cyanothece sp. SIO1E1]